MQTNNDLFNTTLQELGETELAYVSGGATPTGKVPVAACKIVNDAVVCVSGYHDYNTMTSHS